MKHQATFSRRPLALDFSLKVLAPSIAAAGAIALLLLIIINGIFEEANRLDLSYSKRAARSAISSVQENLETVVYDNAYWDEAATEAYLPATSSWFDRVWGDGTMLGVYDVAFVTDLNGTTYYAATDGARARMTATDYFGTEVHKILKVLPSDGLSFGKASGLLSYGSSVNVVAAGVIIPSSEGTTIPAAKPRVLILGKRLDHAMLQNLGRRFVLDNLRFDRSRSSAEATIELLSPQGTKLAILSWEKRSPGDVVRSKFLNVVVLILLLFVFVLCVLVYTSWVGFRDANKSREEALQSALRDDLTGLANRRELMSALAAEFDGPGLPDRQISLVYADLDGFKEVNDAYGHDVGDQLLKAVAAGFAVLASGCKVVARLGGDEFAMIITGADCARTARQLAENMTGFLAEPMNIDGRSASVSVSIGIVNAKAGDLSVEEAIRRADVAMYKAKASGRNRICVYEPSFDAKRDENRLIAKELRTHIDEGRMGVVYQPIVDARTRVIKGVEALVRWPSNTAASFLPEVFVSVAEEFGLVDDLGKFVLKEACISAMSWPELFVSVNVSPIQFVNPGFADMISDLLREMQFSGNRLEVEVTESFIIDNAERAEQVIDQLHAMGVSVALDDFGTGYSSIGHLRRFKFDKLKLDRSMVTDIMRRPSALRLVQGAIAMADSLGLAVVAEGVEDESQVAVLKLAGCGLFQGYLFSKPVEAHDISHLLQRGAFKHTG